MLDLFELPNATVGDTIDKSVWNDIQRDKRFTLFEQKAFRLALMLYGRRSP